MGKVCSLSEAVSIHVQNGDRIAFGGFTLNRKPLAAVNEIIRQGQKDFIIETGAAGSDADMLIGAGRVLAMINGFIGNSGFTTISRRFRDAVEKHKILIEDYSQDAQMLILHGAALGLPFVPVRHLMLGSGMMEHWGISREIRRTIDKLPDEKVVVQDDPFHPGQQVVLLPVPQIDTAIIHVQMASPDGTCRIEGPTFHDLDISMAAKRVIATCEELVSNEEIRKDPAANTIPGFLVDAVCHVPHGSHPSQCYNYYDYDSEFYMEYDEASKTDEGFEAFLRKWVTGVRSQDEYIDKLGASRLEKIEVVPGIGYAVDLQKLAGKE
jgi:glutaconate CoA-transferase subunit A